MTAHPEPLHSVVEGGPSRWGRVVLAHGFTQTLASWGPVAGRLAGRFEVVRVDLPGHGGSGDVRAGFAEAAELVGEAGGVGAYVGYSLGGRLCLRLALDRPDLVPALVLIGGSPGIAHPGERAERRAADEVLARRIERDGVEAFLEAWLAGPLFTTLPAGAAGREERLANTAEGLACALRRLGTGSRSRSGTGWVSCGRRPCWWRGSLTASSPGSPGRWRPPSARPPESPWSPGPGTPPTSSVRPRRRRWSRSS